MLQIQTMLFVMGLDLGLTIAENLQNSGLSGTELLEAINGDEPFLTMAATRGFIPGHDGVDRAVDSIAGLSLRFSATTQGTFFCLGFVVTGRLGR